MILQLIKVAVVWFNHIHELLIHLACSLPSDSSDSSEGSDDSDKIHFEGVLGGWFNCMTLSIKCDNTH